jgi:hypothetical protein
MRGITTLDRQQAARDARSIRGSRRRSRRRRVIAAVLGCVLTTGGAFAATNWVVGLNGGSSGQGQGATIANLTISATASPSPSNVLYPGTTGDVVITISNPNAYPVTITAFGLPANTSYAAGYTNSALTAANAGCTSANSLVAWNFATGVSGTSHTLSTPVTVGASGQANNPLVVTLTSDAVMGGATPSACAGLYFSMPSFTGVTATGGAGTSTTSPATSGWTS